MSLKIQISRFTAYTQYTWMGSPKRVVYFGCGLGDELLCTGVLHELRKRATGRIVMLTAYPDLFRHNPDIDASYRFGHPTVGRFQRWGYPYSVPRYGHYDPVSDQDIAPPMHYIETMCRSAYFIFKGLVDLRPYVHLRPAEKAKGRLFPKQAVIHSAGLALMRNKQWGVGGYQAVANDLGNEVQWIQLGMLTDPPIKGAVDMRGRTTLRESAAIVASSKVVLGEAGFLMHLARAVDTRAVIVYGGREDPAVSGYVANENIVGRTACSPCWQRTRCGFGHECMKMIKPVEVAAAVRRQLAREGTPLEVTQVEIKG